MGFDQSAHIKDLIHAGKAFHVTGIITLTTEVPTYTFIGVVGAVPAHFHDMTFDAEAGPMLIEFIESPTVTVQGSEAVIFNRRRDSGNTPRLKAYGGATITGGIVLDPKKIFGSSSGINTSGDLGIISGEWVLKPGLTYAVRITNQTAPLQDAIIDVKLDFYEELL